MRRIQSALTATALVVLAAISLAAAASVVGRGMSDPRAGTRQTLDAWLCEQDVSQAPADLAPKLARQFEHEMRSLADWTRLAGRLPTDRVSRFNNNVYQLVRAWLEGRIDGYFEARVDDRRWLLDRDLSRIREWQVPQASKYGGRVTIATADGVVYVMGRLPFIYAEASAQERKKLSEFLGVIRRRLSQRTPNFGPPPGE